VTLAPEQTGTLESRIIQRTLRVPSMDTDPGYSPVLVRQLDSALLAVGFTLSAELRDYLSERDSGAVMDKAVQVLAAVRHLVGDHVQHNAYFIDFPRNVPDTVEFWARCLIEAIEYEPAGLVGFAARQASLGGINLLDLPTYGRYQHLYSDLLARHDELVHSKQDRVTVLHLGGTLDAEVSRLFAELAGSTVPLSGDDRDLLAELAMVCTEVLSVIPTRENKAVVNAVRLVKGRPLMVDSVTDVLRTAVAASGGDVTLTNPTRLTSLRRSARRVLLGALDGVVQGNEEKLGDVPRYREAWKRLGERLHPHEYPEFPHAGEAFAVARGDRAARSLASRVEHAFDCSDVALAVRLMANAPGMLLRNTDRVLRAGGADDFLDVLTEAASGASGRVLLALWEHLINRSTSDAARVFVNQAGRSWVTPDDRMPLDPAVTADVVTMLRRELGRRLPTTEHLVVDPAVLDLAVPLSGKSRPGGLGILPRGSVTPVECDSLRFFIHWCQREQRTDYDLSVLLLDSEFRSLGQLSWTSLNGYGGVHSGDLVEAPGPGGASEFIDLHLPSVPPAAAYIVPQVHLYAGEAFTEAEESFFGYMTSDREQAGLPFEPRTVRMKSDLRVPGRVALPMAFMRCADGWVAKWMHLHMTGMAWANRVEANGLSAGLLARGVVRRRYLTIGDLVDLMEHKTKVLQVGTKCGSRPGRPVTFIGLECPLDLPEGSQAYTVERLHELIPQ